MTYNDIQGWFNYEFLYDEVVRDLQDYSIIVEIGAWKGKSTSYLAQKIKESNKNIKLYVVDTWIGTGNEKQHKQLIEKLPKSLYETFIDNMKKMEVRDYLTPLRMDSVSASCLIDDNSVDFVFIDGDHSYEGVKADIEAWWPKLKEGGLIAGHDYGNAAGVVKAVNEKFLSDHLIVRKNVWQTIKPYGKTHLR